jgi:hypothetical protein
MWRYGAIRAYDRRDAWLCRVATNLAALAPNLRQRALNAGLNTSVTLNRGPLAVTSEPVGGGRM